MACPKCGNLKTDTLDSREKPTCRWRRKKCPACKFIFTTREIWEKDLEGEISKAENELIKTEIKVQIREFFKGLIN